jgi:hypothetical protein
VSMNRIYASCTVFAFCVTGIDIVLVRDCNVTQQRASESFRASLCSEKEAVSCPAVSLYYASFHLSSFDSLARP